MADHTSEHRAHKRSVYPLLFRAAARPTERRRIMIADDDETRPECR